MAKGIFRVSLMLMVVVGVNQPFLFSEENGTVPKNGEEILQMMKKQEESLWLQQMCLEQETADLEARQKVLKRRELELEREMQRHMCQVFSLIILVLFKLWRQHLQDKTCQHNKKQETNKVVLVKTWKEVAFHDQAFFVTQGRLHPHEQKCRKTLFSYK